MVVPTYREGGQAQFIERPVPVSTQDVRINALLDFLRQNLGSTHTLDELASRTRMSRRTFTRNFQKATGMSECATGCSPSACAARRSCSK